MTSPKRITLKPPLYILAFSRTLDAHDWVKMNHSTTFWFSSLENAKAYCIRNTNLPHAAKPYVLASWDEVARAMMHLWTLKLWYGFLNPEGTEDRRIWIGDIFQQLQKIGPGGQEAVDVEDNLVDSLDVYCDESGVAPVNEKKCVFVVSALAVPRGTGAGMPVTAYGPSKTAEYLAATKAAHASYKVKPFKGYADALARKIRAYQFVSDVNGEFGRPRIWFSDGSQIRPNHFVWVFAMQCALAWILPLAAKRNGWIISHVRFFFNDYSLTDAMRKFLLNCIVPIAVENAIKKTVEAVEKPFITPLQKMGATRWADKFRVKHLKHLVRQFDSETPFHGDRGLMRLVDRLAHFMYRQVKPKGGKRRFFADLKAVGLKPGIPDDISQDVVEFDAKRLAKWESETGTKLPPD